MIINKITTGFVIQQFDTETQKYIGQSFIASDDVQYENLDGEPLDYEGMAEDNFGPCAPNGEPYLPFDMVQPDAETNLKKI
jgi:hypothetical protein